VEARFAVGSQVGARGLTWDVIEVTPLGAQTRLRLRCTTGDLAGLEWDLLHPAEQVEPLRAELRPDAPGPLAAWRLYHQACLLEQILGPDDALLATPGRVRIEPYQVVPLIRALELSRPRLLLADGVGLGKTVEAGLIASELIARRRAHRILAIVPAGPLLVQWAQELRHRFGLRFTVVADSTDLQQQRRHLELGGNPFDAIALCLMSLDFAKQERVLEELERSAWDLAIIDEAHHCIASAASEAEETQRRRLAEVVARRSDGLLLLTATPHDGYDPHFASLIELLDSSLVDGRGGLVGTAYRRHVVRRLKSHIRDPATGAPLFRQRKVIPVRVAIEAVPVRRFHQRLAALITPRLSTSDDALAFIGLLKRSVSTVSACINTLRVVAERHAQPADTESLRRERARALHNYRKRLRRFGVLDDNDESELADLEIDCIAAELRDLPPAVDALAKLIALGEGAARFDPKLIAVVHEVDAIRAKQPTANVLIYTEYADSQLAAVRALQEAIEGEVLSINGRDGERERSRIADRFTERDGIVVVSTDSLAEGLNLQQRCCHLIHLDLPYNPNRLEQRNGRIDRYGQIRDPQIRYLYLAGTFEERLLLRLIAKYEKARAHLDVMPETLGVTADRSEYGAGLVAGFADKQAGLFDDEPAVIRTVDRVAEESGAGSYRDLQREIDRAFDGFDRSAVRHGWFSEPVSDGVSVPRHHSDIDLPAFVAAAITAETGQRQASQSILRLPPDWLDGLDGLPGFDRVEGVIRLTSDASMFRDTSGHPLAYLGRAHPVVRRACASVRRGHTAGFDRRVSVAAAVGDTPAALLTYVAELRSKVRCEYRWVLAVLLSASGLTVEIAEPEGWLHWPEPRTDVGWRDTWAQWLPERLPMVEATANAAMHRQAERLAAANQSIYHRETQQLQAWLGRRTEEICGKYVPRITDLFGNAPSGPDWQQHAAPLDRLAGLAADPNSPAAPRREAAKVVALYQRRNEDLAAYACLAPPALSALGMLMLVP
jgi:superfamily II DNA or RNA helicase